MIRRFFFITIFCLNAFCLSAQGPIWNWETNCGSTASDKSLDVSMGSDGSVYSCGYFNGSGQFGSITLSGNNTSKETFLAKQDMFGNYLWAKNGVGGLDDRALGVCVDKDDNIIITGTYWGNITFGSQLLTGSADHIFVTKYDSSGNVIWAITGGGDGDDHGYDVTTDANGNIFLTGLVSTHYGPPTCTGVFGNVPTFTYTDSLAFVAKISPAGQWIWVQTFDGTDVERDNDIALDNAGNVYVCGGFYGNNCVFGTTTLNSNAGSRDIFVVKYDANGNFQWVRNTGGYEDDRANGITVGADNKIYVTGEFRAELVFGHDTLNNNGGPGGKDIFVAKMDVNGNWFWASKAGSSSGGESGRAITSTSQHCLFITGQAQGASVEFGDSLSFNTGTNGIQAFVAGIDTAGEWRWILQAGGPDEDRGYGIAADDQCRVYFCGYFAAPWAVFGPFTDSTYGRKDGFTVRLDVTCFDYVTDTLSGISPTASGACQPQINQVLVPDGNADAAFISIRNADCFSSGEWRIYNIWGETVFVTNDLGYAWRGTDQTGNELPAGTYYYTLSTEDRDQHAQSITGRILLVR